MAKENMTIRMEPELKAQVKALFEVKIDEPNTVTYLAMEAAEKGEDIYGPFDSMAELMEAINA